ncbi:hypothetical protein [Paenibacillus alkalitolerans]|uniref:hypothetical protein n=1 Tax=Paenibacillus alkalitolerans TaxID=2799335 RepID=UPI0018F6AC33|nr:hypothetical protein [Paenibacillus alkalitolerans]
MKERTNERITVYRMNVDNHDRNDKENKETKRRKKRIGIMARTQLISIIAIFISIAGMLYFYHENIKLNNSLYSAFQMVDSLEEKVQALENDVQWPGEKMVSGITVTEKIENYIKTKHFFVDGIMPPHKSDPIVLIINFSSNEVLEMSDEIIGKEMMGLLSLIKRRFEMNNYPTSSNSDEFKVTINVD